MKKTQFVLAAASFLAAGAALAQPRIVTLGSNAIGTGVADGGNVIAGHAGQSAARWTISGSTVTLLPLTGSNNAWSITPDGQFISGTVLNTGGLGGLPTDATIAARWSQATGWVALAPVLPDPSLGVTGAGVSGGEISSPRGMSDTGQFVVGQTYIAPDETYMFRGYYWNAATGQSHVLPTSFNPDRNRFRDGRALAASADGSVIVGGEDPHSSDGRVIVWRWNTTTASYDMTFLPDGVDGKGNPNRRSVDGFFINAAGTIISGTSFEYDPKLGYSTGPYLARWFWDAGSSSWTRELIDDQLTELPSWWTPPSWCDIPHQLIPTGMSDDGNTIVGIVMFSLCGSFQRGGFIWTSTDNQVLDFYDYLFQEGTPGITDFGPTEEGLPPRLGWPNAVSADGDSFTGYGGPFSGFGPGWVVNLAGGGCVAPFITGSPEDVLLSRCNTFIMNAGAGGSGPLSFQWYRDNQPLADGPAADGSFTSGATSSQLRIENVNPAIAGSYRCIITGACGKPVSTGTATAVVDPNVTPAPNDTCSTATEIGEGTFDFNPCGAFVDDAVNTLCAVTSNTDVWFAYTPTFTGNARFETCAANYDTVLSVYDACNGIELACNDDRSEGPLGDCSWTGSRIPSFAVTEGVTVYVRVANLGFLFDFSAGQLTISEAPPPAVNDYCTDATPAVVGVNNFSTDEATNDVVPTGCGFHITPRDVWFSYTPSADGAIDLTTCGTSWDTVLTIYDSCFGNELACNDDSQSDECYSQSTIEDFQVSANTIYLIRVGTNWDSGGPGTLTISTGSDCAADFNGDSLLNSQDFFDFLTAFFDVLPNADFNRDSVINSQDFFDFLTAFFAGC